MLRVRDALGARPHAARVLGLEMMAAVAASPAARPCPRCSGSWPMLGPAFANAPRGIRTGTSTTSSPGAQRYAEQVRTFRRAGGSTSHVRSYASSDAGRSSARPSGSDSSSSSSSRPRVGRFYRWAFYTIYIAPFVVLLERYTYSVSRVEGASMSPTLNPTLESQIHAGLSDHVILNRWAADTGKLRHGDIVYLYSPVTPDLRICKRIVALAGDIVRVRTGGDAARFPSETDFTRPRARIPRSSASAVPDDDEEQRHGHDEDDGPGSGGGNGAEQERRGSYKLFRIPEGHAWVEGDASASLSRSDAPGQGWSSGKSRDSRDFGPVSLALVDARVDYIFFPLSRAGRPGRRPNADVTESRVGGRDTPAEAAGAARRRIRASRVAQRLRGAATSTGESHPDDSPISPYVLDLSDKANG